MACGPRSAVREYEAFSVRLERVGCSALKKDSSCTFQAPDRFHVGSQRDERLRPMRLVPS